MNPIHKWRRQVRQYVTRIYLVCWTVITCKTDSTHVTMCWSSWDQQRQRTKHVISYLVTDVHSVFQSNFCFSTQYSFVSDCRLQRATLLPVNNEEIKRQSANDGLWYRYGLHGPGFEKLENCIYLNSYMEIWIDLIQNGDKIFSPLSQNCVRESFK